MIQLKAPGSGQEQLGPNMKKLLLIFVLIPLFAYSQDKIIRQSDLRNFIEDSTGSYLPDSVFYTTATKNAIKDTANVVRGNINDSLDVLREKNIYNVMDYGAVRDGATNTRSAIQNLIDDLKGVAGYFNSSLSEIYEVFLPKGTYVIDSNLVTYSGIRLVGEQGTEIKEASSFDGDALITLRGITGTATPYGGGLIENIKFTSKDTASTIAAISDDALSIGNSRFENLFINTRYGLIINGYAQFSTIKNLLCSGTKLETMLLLIGNDNRIEDIDKEAETGWVSGKPYIIIGDSTGTTNSERNVLNHILIEGAGIAAKKGIWFVNADYSEADNLWFETIPALDVSIQFDSCDGFNYVGKTRGFEKIKLVATPSVDIEEVYMTDAVNGWEDKIELDTLSSVKVRNLFASVSSTGNYLPVNNNIKVDKVYSAYIWGRQDETTDRYKEWVEYPGNTNISNLAVNGSFEAGAYGWIKEAGTYADTIVPSEVSSGNMYKIDFTGYVGNNWLIYQSYTIPSSLIGSRVTISAKVKVDSAGFATMWIANCGSVVEAYTEEISADSGWHTIIHTVKIASAGNLQFGILFYDAGGLDADNVLGYIDDFTVTVNGLVQTNNTPAFGNLTLNGNNIFYGNEAPTDGIWKVGDKVFNDLTVETGAIGWICTVAGEPGTWKAFGIIDGNEFPGSVIIEITPSDTVFSKLHSLDYVHADGEVTGANATFTSDFTVTDDRFNGIALGDSLVKGRVAKLDTIICALSISNDSITNGSISGKFCLPYDATLTKVRAIIADDGGANDTAYCNVKFQTNLNDALNTIWASDSALTNDSTGHVITSFGDATIPAESWIYITVSDVGGTVTQINIVLRGRYD